MSFKKNIIFCWFMSRHIILLGDELIIIQTQCGSLLHCGRPQLGVK